MLLGIVNFQQGLHTLIRGSLGPLLPLGSPELDSAGIWGSRGNRVSLAPGLPPLPGPAVLSGGTGRAPAAPTSPGTGRAYGEGVPVSRKRFPVSVWTN